MWTTRYFAPRYFAPRYWERGVSSGTYSLVGPASGYRGEVSTPFTVSPDQDSDGVIVTPHSTGTGVFFPESIVIDHSSPAIFTYQPLSVAGSPHIITTTNNGVLANPAGIEYAITINRSFLKTEILPGGKTRIVRMLTFDS